MIKQRTFSGPPLPNLFPLGKLGITPSVSYLLNNVVLRQVFEWHGSGWWCEPEDLLSQDDQEANERVLAYHGDGGLCGEVLSKFRVIDRVGKPVEIYVLTILAGMQTHTVVCLPEER